MDSNQLELLTRAGYSTAQPLWHNQKVVKGYPLPPYKTQTLLGAMVEEFIRLFRSTTPADKLAEMAEKRAVYGRDLLPALQDRLELVAMGTEFIPGIKLLPAPGHRRDHVVVEIQSGQQVLLHVVDSFRHPIQVTHPDWLSFIDAHPTQIAQTNRWLLQRAVQKEALVFGAHLAFPGLGYIRQVEGSGFVWERWTVQSREKEEQKRQ